MKMRLEINLVPDLIPMERDGFEPVRASDIAAQYTRHRTHPPSSPFKMVVNKHDGTVLRIDVQHDPQTGVFTMLCPTCGREVAQLEFDDYHNLHCDGCLHPKT
jgi:hypothetical protein